MRCALTSAIAAATPPSSSSSTGGRRRRDGGAGRRVPALDGGVRRCRRPFDSSRSSSRASPGWSRDELVAVAALEERAPLVRDRVGVLEVLLEDEGRVARVQSVDSGRDAIETCCSSDEPRYQSGWLVTTAIVMPRKKQTAPIITAANASRW